MSASPAPSRSLILSTAVLAVAWVGCALDAITNHWLPEIVSVLVALLSVALAYGWWRRTTPENHLSRSIVLSAGWFPAWQACVTLADLLALDKLRGGIAQFGLMVTYLIGLGWAVWWLERAAQFYERARSRSAEARKEPTSDRIRNPLDPAAWFYGRKHPRLNQSLAGWAVYSLAFTLLISLLSGLRGCQEALELPAGGGQTQAVAQSVQIQKVIRKKFVINPFSSVNFSPPPIEEVQLKMQEITSHLYAAGKVGFGEGDGAGFAGGTAFGRVSFIRLEYSGGDWDQDFGVGADLNMLTEYGVRTQQKIASRTESRTISQLRNFVSGKSPPFVFLTGQRSISVSENEKKILREYLLDQHGMIFCDNGGSRHFHNQFLQLMNDVLERKVEPVPVPLDDPIHRQPFAIPFLPYVAPHGGKEALGWKVDGRWVAYYSPGDIADAWADGHAGVKPEIWEYCYQLGTNVIYYAYREHAQWRLARDKK